MFRDWLQLNAITIKSIWCKQVSDRGSHVLFPSLAIWFLSLLALLLLELLSCASSSPVAGEQKIGAVASPSSSLRHGWSTWGLLSVVKTEREKEEKGKCMTVLSSWVLPPLDFSCFSLWGCCALGKMWWRCAVLLQWWREEFPSHQKRTQSKQDYEYMFFLCFWKKLVYDCSSATSKCCFLPCSAIQSYDPRIFRTLSHESSELVFIPVHSFSNSSAYHYCHYWYVRIWDDGAQLLRQCFMLCCCGNPLS